MKIYFFLIFIIVCTFFKDVWLWELGSKSPVIYPERFDIVVDAYTDLTLGCRGSEKLNWTFHDDYNTPRNNSFTINHSINENDPDYKFEAILKVEQMRHTDVGFYYCHGQQVPYNTPLRSNSIYIYVNDSNELSVLSKDEYHRVSRGKHIIQCRATSPDVNIDLIRNGQILGRFNASNYNYYKFKPHQYVKAGKYALFHPYYGFSIYYHFYGTYICQFSRGNTSLQITLEYGDFIDSRYIVNLEGPDEVNLNNNVTLTCVITVHGHLSIILSYYDPNYWLYNEKYINDTRIIIKNQLIPMKYKLIIRSELTIHNVSTRHSGLYSCKTLKDKRISSRGPRILQGMEPIWKKYNEPVMLTCEGPNRMVWYWYDDFKQNFYKEEYTANFFDNTTKMNKTNLLWESDSSARIYCCDYDLQKCDTTYVLSEDTVYVWKYVSYEYNYIPCPCISTSSKCNISLKMVDKHNRQDLRPTIEKYNKRKGFLVKMPQFLHHEGFKFSCIYKNPIQKIANFHYKITSVDYRSPPSIIGPRLSVISMNEKLELLCKMFVYHNVSIDMLQWETPPKKIKYDKIIDNLSSFNISQFKVIISKLIMDNVTRDHEGIYKCYIPNSDLLAQEYITVIDPFNIEPSLEIVEYSSAYIGKKMNLKCSVNISHNAVFNISWNIQNEIETTNDQGITNVSYVNGIEYVYATSNLHINNVTRGHAGNYTCIVNDYSNRKRYATKKVLTSDGKQPKIQTCNFRNNTVIKVKLYSKLILNCSVDGDPKPYVIWKQNSRDLNLSRGVELSSDKTEMTITLVLDRNEGLYKFTVWNLFGEDHREVNVVVIVYEDVFTSTSLAFIGIAVIALAILSTLLGRRIYRQKKLKKDILTSGLVDIELLDYDTKWEIPREKIILGKTLGSGYFGCVMKSSILDFFEDDPDKTVAVKLLHPYCGLLEINALISELHVLAHLENHINLIKFLGASTQNVQKKQLLIIMEYCEHGSLGDYLITKRDKFINLLNSDGILSFADVAVSFDGEGYSERVSTLELVYWALQVAQGMQFLAASKVVHGDLAARNVLLAQNNIVKISDFGLARNLGTKSYYKKKSQCPLPIKWMAIESIRDKTFSIESDVWSFGVFLWELFSLARTPYPDLQLDMSFYNKILSGYRLECPAYSSLQIYKLMSDCWQLDPARRPTFENLIDTLASFLPSQLRQVYLPDHLCQNIVFAELHSDPNDQQNCDQESVSIVVEDSPISE